MKIKDTYRISIDFTPENAEYLKREHGINDLEEFVFETIREKMEFLWEVYLKSLEVQKETGPDTPEAPHCSKRPIH
jgi:hypothetical protein